MPKKKIRTKQPPKPSRKPVLKLRRQTEKALRESEAQLRAALQSTADGILAVDSKGKVLQANQRFAELWRIPKTLLERKDDQALLDFVLDQLIDPDAFLKKVKLLYNSDAKDMDILIFKDGRVFERYSQPMIMDGAVIGRVWSFRDITERKRAEEVLRKSEVGFRSIWEKSNDGMRVTNEAGDVISVNDAYCKMMEKPRAEIEGKPMSVVYEEARQTEIINKHQERFRSRSIPPHIERTITLWNGKKISLELSNTFLGIADQPIVSLSIFRDITERKRAEEQLRKLSLAVEQSPATIVITDTHGNIEYVNPKFTQTTGYTWEEALGKNPRILKSGEMPAEGYKTLWENITTGKEWRGEFHNKKKNGDLYWETASISPVKDKDNVITHFVAVKEDITERRKAESEIRLLAQTLASTKDCISIADLEDKIIFVNNAFLQTYRYTREELIGQPISIVRLVNTPSEVGNQILAGTLAGGWYGELLNCRKDGSEVPVELWTSVVKDESGKLVATVGVARDITDRKHAEEALRTSTAKLETLVQVSPLAITLLDSDGNVQLWNTAAEQIFGWRSEEVIGHPNPIVPLGKQDEYKTLSAQISTGKSITNLETVRQRKDGTFINVSISSVPIYDAVGNVGGRMAIFADITLRKYMEGEREKLILELQEALANIKTLSGLIPICASCKKIRDDKGYWNQLEKYIIEHSGAKFTHGICPECAEKFRNEFKKDKK